MNNPLGAPAHAMLPVNVKSKSKQRAVDKALDEATCNNNNGANTQQPSTTSAAPTIAQNHKKLYNPLSSFLSSPPSTTAGKDRDKSLRPNMHLHLDPASAGVTGESSSPSSRRHSLAVSTAGHSSRSSTDSALGPFASWRRASTSVPAGAESAPLTAADAVVGLIAASCQAQRDLEALNTSPALKRPLGEVKSFKMTAQLLHKFLRRVEAGTLAHRDRPGLMELDVLVAVLTASVLTVSELEARLEGLVMQAGELGVSVDEMVQRYSRSLAKDANRIAMLDFIMTQLLNVLHVHQDAARHRAQAGLAVMDMLQADAALAGRMQQLQDAADGLGLVSPERRAEVASRPPPSYSVPSPGGGDEPPNYDQALDDDSVAIQPRDWSVYSGLSLMDIPALSSISLPLILGEIQDAYYYTEEYAHSVRDGLIALEDARNTQKSKALARVLGIEEGGSKEKDSAASDHGGLAHRLALKVARGKLLSRSH
ncbi:hypothetical protein MGU_02404 [Metarhizium guizhouense ARSEF 977]|uniref:Uncharacterized protein n=1 Tax=Metarhizium guizhouense (strain ARSEF 977) TaxID=1276136 RepID=A0A0B4HED0_METGA|nr:hypothetical protein MGU_02404 [Metarhizium guizhouense ARSEF 977]